MAPRASPPDLTQLVADHHAVLYRYAYRLTGSSADAEDLTQQVFLIAQTKLEQVRSQESVRAWLFAVLRNAYLKSHRKKIPLPAASLDFDVESIPAEPPTPDQIDGEELQAALDDLPAEFKVVLLLFYFEHRSYKEISEQLDLPIGTVMSRLSRAKGHLRARLFDRSAEPQIRSRKTTARVQ